MLKSQAAVPQRTGPQFGLNFPALAGAAHTAASGNRAQAERARQAKAANRSPKDDSIVKRLSDTTD